MAIVAKHTKSTKPHNEPLLAAIGAQSQKHFAFAIGGASLTVREASRNGLHLRTMRSSPLVLSWIHADFSRRDFKS